jgi:hypothetical protein
VPEECRHGGVGEVDEATSPRLGTAASSVARFSSESPRASARDLTVCGCGCLLCLAPGRLRRWERGPPARPAPPVLASQLA